ncbi:MAG: hypothetical protein EBX39_12945, partial [Actinobacteria bacterium]|nr:hypothetical protein [Actinomycetota bacterium]
VASLTANVAGPALTLTVNEADNLTVGNIVNPHFGKVVLNTAGDIVSASGTSVWADDLRVTANSAVISTKVDILDATITGNSTTGLNVAQTGNLAIFGALTTAGSSPIVLRVGGGNLTGPGTLNAGGGAGDVSLATPGGATTLNMFPPQVIGNRLSITAQNSSDITTTVKSITATILQGGESLTVLDSDGFSIDPAGIAANGVVTLTTLAGDIDGNGVIDAGTVGTLLLQALGGNIALAGVPNQVRAFYADATTGGGDINVTTKVDQISAGAAGALTIVEADDLAIVATGLVAGQGQNITVTAAGNITLIDNVTGDNTSFVSLTSQGGFVRSTSGSTVVFGNRVSINASTTSTLQTSVNSLAANITGSGDLFVTNKFDAQLALGANLSIDPRNIILQGGSLSISLDNSTPASLLGSGLINTNGGNVTFSV